MNELMRNVGEFGCTALGFVVLVAFLLVVGWFLLNRDRD